jgi:hypothetical protein
MRRCILLATAGSLLLGAANAAEAESPLPEIGLRYRFSAFQGPPVYTMGQKLILGARPTETLSSLPRTRSARPLFGAATLGRGGDTTLSFLLDESKGTGKGYDLLVIDRNNNESLADDPPLRGGNRRFAFGFSPLPLLITVDGRTRIYHAAIETQPRPPMPAGSAAPPAEYTLKGLGYVMGEVRFASRVHPVAIVDFNANGIYGDSFRSLDFRPQTMGDMVLVDANHDGRFEQSGPISRESLYCGRCIVVDGRFYELAVRPDGSALRVTPANAPLVAIRSEYPRLGLMLASRDGILPLDGKDGTVRVPPGDYKVLYWNVEHPTGSGRWQVSGGTMGDAGNAPTLTISERGSAAFRLSRPLVAKVSAAKSGLGGSFDFQFSLATTSGESINNVALDGRQPPAPTLRLLDEQGKEVANLTFHYG